MYTAFGYGTQSQQRFDEVMPLLDSNGVEMRDVWIIYFLLPAYNVSQVSQVKKGIIQDTTNLCPRAVHTSVYFTKCYIFA